MPKVVGVREIKDLSELTEGTIVRGRLSGESYVVTANYGDYVIAVRTVHVTQPHEWQIVEVK